MRQIWVISRRELQSFFDSLTAYIMLVAFLGFSGFFTWLFGSDIFFVKQASLQAFFGVAYWTLFFFIPALTMRQIAEENKTGTIELLVTRPISDWQIVIGKFLATLLLIVIALAFTLPYYFTVASLGNIDHGAVISGYLGLILISAAYISIGIFTSSVSNNQIIGFLLALAIGILFQFLFSFISGGTTGIVSQVLYYLSLSTHFESISRGVIDSRDIIFFFSLIFMGLVSAEAMLQKNRN
ncbi:MAG: ABC transporter permease [Bacteroidetes bacterium 4484_276]|nr:MAG: ABC transporter permease [Bacteroidetes bacterium 4484_276]OYT14184.1 MAG: ABC transporter permease [Bacteroidetes bacterium 4572_114]